MKKLILVALSLAALWSCSYDDSDLYGKVDELDARITEIETQVKEMNTQIGDMSTIVNYLKNGKVITSVEDLEGSYKLTFSDASTIIIKNGKDGVDGKNGKDGVDGQDGENAPVIGIKKDDDGKYYWTSTVGEITDWLLDLEENKISAEGITPIIGVDAEGYWTIDLGNGAERTIPETKATGNDGDSFFRSVTEEDHNVILTLADNSVIIIPKANSYNILPLSYFFTKSDSREFEMNLENISNVKVFFESEGWSASISGNNITITAPSVVDSTGMVTVIAVNNEGETIFSSMQCICIVPLYDFLNVNGSYVLNEGNMTNENGQVSFIDAAGAIHDSIYYKVNNEFLGNVAQDMDFCGDYIYYVTQNGSQNGSGNKIIMCDAKTMKKIVGYNGDNIVWPTHIKAIDSEHIYVRADGSYGNDQSVYSFNSETKEITHIEGTKGARKNRMERSNGHVFVLQGSNVLVIGDNEVKKTIDMGGETVGFSIKDENHIYVAVKGKPAHIAIINTSSLEIESTSTLADTFTSGYGWCASSYIASYGDDIYYSNGDLIIYKHNMTTGKETTLVKVTDFGGSDYTMGYNTVYTHPISGHVFMGTIEGYGGYLDNNLFEFDFSGKNPSLINNYEDHCHFIAGMYFYAYSH